MRNLGLLIVALFVADAAPLPAQPVSLTAAPTSLTFQIKSGAAGQTLTLQVGGTSGTPWQATASTSVGGEWLSVSPATGTIPASINVTAISGRLPPGTYQGSVVIAAPATPSSIAVTVNLAVGTELPQSPPASFSPLYELCGQGGGCPDGSGAAALLLGSDGNFYGTAPQGGTLQFSQVGAGTIFKITPSGIFTTIYSFCAQLVNGICADGAFPNDLIQGSDGSLYGTTVVGGAANAGTIFKITTGGTFTTLYSFCVQAGCPDGGGGAPTGLILATDGNFYGTTSGSSPYRLTAGGPGAIFKMTPGGTLTTLYTFCSQFECAPGTSPSAPLVQGSDGNFYGTTDGGGISGGGTVFKITPSGTLTTLYSFCTVEGCQFGPEAKLVQGADGNFYGTTNRGSIFKITPSGTLTTLYSFGSVMHGGISEDGIEPGGLILASDGNFYGTTAYTIFQMTPSGALTTLLNFCAVDYITGSQCQYALGGLIQTNDGNFYGSGGLASVGQIGVTAIFNFSMTPPPVAISPGGIVALDSTLNSFNGGEWVSIFGSNLAGTTMSWNGDFPTSLGGTTVVVNGKPAYLSFVSPTQINFQAPDVFVNASLAVVVANAAGRASEGVISTFLAPSFLLVDSRHVAGIILRSDGSGAYGGGSYDLLGPTGNTMGFGTVAAKAGDAVALFAVGLGPTNPAVPAGQSFSGAAPATSPVSLFFANSRTSVKPSFAGLSGAGLYQINFTVPSGLGTGDVPITAAVSSVPTQTGVVIALQ